MASEKALRDIANILRRDSLISTSEAGSGHPTSCLSCAEMLSVLFFKEMSYDSTNPSNPDNDEFILSKGHAAPILYSALFRAGCIKNSLKSLRKLSSPLEGHPMPGSFPWVKVASGSLGQGLSIGIGMALAIRLQKRNSKVYVLMGDSESSEGSVWEGLQLASYYNLNNLIAIFDINKLGQRGETMLGHNIKTYEKRIQSFGWNTIAIEGHNIGQVLKALNKAKKSSKPTAILAKTIKGKGVSFIEGKNGWHGKALNPEELEKALKEIQEKEMPLFDIVKPKPVNHKINVKKPSLPLYKLNELVATRKAYGETLAALAEANPNIIAVDAEVSNSTFSEIVKEKTPSQFIETFIQEQNMIGITLGLSKKGLIPYSSTFAAFLSRAHDQLRMSALSQADFTVSGSHCGVSIGEDGPSQMGLEDIDLFRSLPNSIVFYPSDATSTSKIVEMCSKLKGIKYIRTTRPATPVIYNQNETFPIGEFKALKASNHDQLVLAGSGITLHEALKAHEELLKKGIKTSVIDLYCIKPFDAKKFTSFVKTHGNKIVIAEDHYSEGGIGEMITSSLSGASVKIKHLAIREIPHSGKKEELLDAYGISWKSMVKEARGF